MTAKDLVLFCLPSFLSLEDFSKAPLDLYSSSSKVTVNGQVFNVTVQDLGSDGDDFSCLFPVDTQNAQSTVYKPHKFTKKVTVTIDILSCS